jgi:hypothetical protein
LNHIQQLIQEPDFGVLGEAQMLSRRLEMKLYMKKTSLMIGVFAALLTFAFSNQSGSFSLAAPSAYAAACSKSNNSNPNSNAQNQVMICHYPPGNQSNPETITVGQPSTVLNGHMDHSDTFGACLVCPPGAASCVNAYGLPGIIAGTYGGPGMSGGAPGLAGGVNIIKPTSLRNLKGS